MESRKITIISSATQSRKEIMSSAETLGELKADLREVGIDYDGMTFMEGLTKTEFKSDESILPTNVNYKGTVTNNLVFRLTKEQKKIKSGMNRKECYDFMKKNPSVAANFKLKFGKNYTNASTKELESFIGKNNSKPAPAKKVVEKVVTKKPAVENSAKKPSCNSSSENTIVNSAKVLVEKIYKANGLSEANYLNLLGVLNGNEASEVDSSYSDAEINDMFKGM